MQRIADRVASWLVPVALLIAILAYCVSPGTFVTGVTVPGRFLSLRSGVGNPHRYYGGHRAGPQSMALSLSRVNRWKRWER